MNFLSASLEVIQVTMPVFAVIAIGYLLRLKKVFKDGNVEVLNKIAYNIALPALVFLNITKYKLSEIFNARIILIVYSTALIFIFFTFLINLGLKVPDKTKGAIIVASFRTNIAFVGFPIILAAFGSLAMAKASLIVAFLLPVNVIATVTIFKIYSRKEEKADIKKIILGFFTDPLLIAAVMGIIFSYFNVYFPPALTGILDILSGMGIGIALLSIGASFKFLHIKKNIGLLSYVTINKLIIMPLTALVFSTFIFKVDVSDRNIVCVLFATPLAVMSYIMAVRHNSDSDFLSSALILSTIISAITISGWLLLLKLF